VNGASMRPPHGVGRLRAVRARVACVREGGGGVGWAAGEQAGSRQRVGKGADAGARVRS
jgi:hypothetical protein